MPPMPPPKNFGRGGPAKGVRKVHIDERECRVCRGMPVEAAHLWPRARGATGFDNPDIVVALCRPCHKALDTHQLELLPHLTLDEQVALTRAAGGIWQALKRVTVQ